MSVDKLLEALGATDENDALRLLAEGNQFMEDVKQATGRETFEGALSVLRSSVSFARDLEKQTEKTTPEALGVVLAWKSAFEKLPAVEARVGELEETVRLKDVQALIAQGLQKPGPGASEHAGKLTQATAEFWKTQPVAQLRAFLAVAPRVMPTEASQPSVNPNSGSPDLAKTHADAAFSTKKYEDITPSERAEINRTDPILYAALREDWVARGEPPPSGGFSFNSNGSSPLKMGATIAS